MERYDDDIVYKQPELCKGCEWGTWTGTKQTCLRLKCQKQNNEYSVADNSAAFLFKKG